MKTVGITGPRGSGKTSLWRAITGGTSHGDTGVVSVRDERLDDLVRLHSSSKKVPVNMEFVDVHIPSRTDAAATGRLREMDAIVVLVPAFGGLDPEKARREATDDLVLADITPIDNRITRARKEPASAREVQTLENALKTLEAGRFLGEEPWDEPDVVFLSHLAPLTLKPILFVDNVSEERIPVSDEGRLAISARLEVEVAGMDEAAARELLREFGVERSAAEIVPSRVFGLLDLITFFTINEEECRAWELRRGATAVQAAGAIHSDLERGFIRAEVASFGEVMAAGSWNAAKAAGKIRLEGKDYAVKDGDVIRVRFAV